MLQKTVLIVNRRGLHARASAKLVNLASEFEAMVFVEKDGERVSAQSVMGLMMLTATCGCEVTLFADGAQAETALAAVTALIERGFDEED